MLAGRGPRGVEQGRLHEEHERALVHRAPGVRRLRRHHLLQCAAEMDRRRAGALRRGPRHRPIQRPVDLERRRTVAIALERSPIPVGQTLSPAIRNELARREVEQHQPRRLELGQVLAPAQRSRSRRRASGSTPRGRRPRAASRLAGSATRRHVPRRRAAGRTLRSRQCRAAGTSGPRCRRRAPAPESPKRAPRQAGRGRRAEQAESRHHERMPGDPERRRQHVVRELVPAADERREQPPPVAAARSEPLGGGIERPLEQRRGAVVERVGQRRRAAESTPGRSRPAARSGRTGRSAPAGGPRSRHRG